MDESKFKIEEASDVSELYPRIEVTRIGDSFAFLDFSTTAEKNMVINFWSKDSVVQVPFELMAHLMQLAKDYSAAAIRNEAQLSQGD